MRRPLWQIGIPVVRRWFEVPDILDVDRELRRSWAPVLAKQVGGPSGVFVEFFPGHGPVVTP